MSKLVYLFKGSNCSPCKVFEPIFDKVVENFNITVEKHVDNFELMGRFNIRSVPAVVLVNTVGERGRLEVEHILVGSALRSSVVEKAITEFVNNTQIN